MRKVSVTLIGFALLGAPIASSAPAPAPHEASARSLSALMEQGQQALLARDFKAARDDFSDVLTADPRNQMALDGATLAYLELNDFSHAKLCLEKGLALSPHPTRWTAINGAAIYLHGKVPMRGVRLLIDYMTPIPAVDEAALDALAVCLNQTDEQARKARLFTDAANFYAAQTKKLEQLNPGMKRWGTTWLAADEVDDKTKEWTKSLNASTKLAHELAALKAHLAQVERSQGDPVFEQRVQIQNYRGGRNSIDPLNDLSLDRVKPAVAAKQDEYDKAMKLADRPPIPDKIDPVNINSLPVTVLARASEPSEKSAFGTQPGDQSSSDSNPASHPTTQLTVVPPSDLPAPPDPTTTRPTGSDGTTSPPAGTGSTIDPPPNVSPPRKAIRVTSYSAAFAVGENLLITSAEAVADASEIQVQIADGAAFPATIVRTDPAAGLALLRVPATKFAWLNLADQFAGGTLSCISFPTVDLFQPSASTIPGSSTLPKEPWHIRLSETPRLAGGPILANGKVVGVELATRDSDVGAIPAVTLDHLKKFLAEEAIQPGTGTAVAATVQLTAIRDK